MSQTLLELLVLCQLLWEVCTPVSPSRMRVSHRGEADTKLSTQKCKDENEESADLSRTQMHAQVLDLKPPFFLLWGHRHVTKSLGGA